MASRHFIGDNHPLFKKPKGYDGYWDGKGCYPYKDSIYYYWFEFLRRSEKYQKACAKNGKGMQRIYNDFGDVFAKGFKDWWYEPAAEVVDGKVIGELNQNRGAVLFSEPAPLADISLVTGYELDEFKDGWDEDEMLMIAVPLHFKKAYIQKQVNKIINDNGPKRGRGQRTFRTSKAKYPIANRFQISPIKSALLYYDTRKQHPKSTLWEIDNIITKRFDPKEPNIDIEKNRAGVQAKRFLNYADNLIEGVEKGEFPYGQRKR